MIKQNHAFQFLTHVSDSWARMGESIERSIYKDKETAIFKSRKLAELVLEEILINEEIDVPDRTTAAEKMSRLYHMGIITDDVNKSFHRVRRRGNQAVHELRELPMMDALKVHKSLYEICAWYVETYGPLDADIPGYQDPEPEDDEQRMYEMMKKHFNDFLSKGSTKEETESGVEEDSVSSEGPYKKYYGSHLLYQLNKLRESSQEAIEGYQSLSSFKKYLHIKRPIQEELEEKLENASSTDQSQLVFLCGSVGDGKSHLLAYLQSTYPDLMDNFEIYNDATESFDPKKDSLDTLADSLTPFDDEHIHTSSKKMVLAINLGVLHNFLETDYAKDRYKILKTFIGEAKVFDETSINREVEHENFSLVSFGDYHEFELTENGPVSPYIETMLEKIVAETEDNPFHKAYLKDLKNDWNHPILMNYKFLKAESVRTSIIRILIETIMKDKVIISTRTLLNFIYDILVPTFVEDIDSSDMFDMIPYLLPALLFEGEQRSTLLKAVSNQDPIHYRSQEVDEKIIGLHNTNNLGAFMRSTITDPFAEEWIDMISDEPMHFIDSKSSKKSIGEMFIRCSFLFRSTLNSSFKDVVYDKYTSYLYAFNSGDMQKLSDMYYEVQNSIFLWKGSPQKNYIYLDDEMENMRIAEELKPRKSDVFTIEKREGTLKRFLMYVVLGYRVGSETIPVDIDYPLFKTLSKVREGYRLSKKDKEDSIKFEEFIDKLLPLGNQKEEILIQDHEEGLKFLLEYEGYGEYSFSRES
ncbi:DNA phosphorothioation-dependent restriction protein DptF [Halobacillus sp. SY10]|uniref:DNA phosphorothioation-dependent restriction protein DptF n=1 Tax=Halobacillus sp. SY10 TaxID=3381356 RepID=UPI00387A640A